MTTNFPTSIDALVNPVATDSLATVNHANQHANANDAIEALEAKVGVDNSSVTTSLDYRVRNINASTAIISGNTSTDLVRITQTGTGNALLIEDTASDTTPFVITASGSVCSGGTSSYPTYFYTGTGFNATPRILSHTFDLFSSCVGGYSWGNSNNGVYSTFGKSRGTTVGDMTIVQSGDYLSTMQFAGSDGTRMVEGARISVGVEDTPAVDSMPAFIAFSTSTNGTINPAERVRISNTGNLGVGTNAPTSKLHVNGSFSRGAPVTKTASFTLADTDNWIICNGTASITVTLPTASTQVGREISLKNIAAFTVVSASSNVVPISSATAGTAILPATVGSWATLVSNGTNWVIMQS